MDINEKILWQLVDPIRSTCSGPEAISLVLPFIAWWKIQKKGALPAAAHLEKQLENDLPGILAALHQVQSYAPASFVNEGVFKKLGSANELYPLIKKVVDLGEQGLLNTLSADDSYFWIADKHSPLGLTPSLATLLIELLDHNDRSVIYTPWDYSGQLAARVLRRGGQVLVETPMPLFASQVLTLVALDHWKMHASDPVLTPRALENGRLKLFSAALAVPPMGIRYDRTVVENDLFARFTEKTASGSVLQIQHLMAQTAGRIIVVVPNSVLFSVGTERSFRQELVERGCIEAIIALPSGLLTGSNIPTSVLILNTEKRSQQIRFVNADSEKFRASGIKKRTDLIHIDDLVMLAKQENSGAEAIDVAYDDIRKNDFNLEVSRYVLDTTGQKLEQVLATLELVRLGDHFEIIRSRQHSTSSSGVSVREVQASDIPDFGITLSASKESLFDQDSPKATNYFLRPNDILLAIKGSVGKVGIIAEAPLAGEGGWLAGQSFVVLRPSKNAFYDPKALLIYLRSEIGQALLSRLVVGASMPTIQLASLKDLEIPFLSQTDMSEVSHVVEREVQIQQEIRQLRHKQVSLSSALWKL